MNKMNLEYCDNHHNALLEASLLRVIPTRGWLMQLDLNHHKWLGPLEAYV